VKIDGNITGIWAMLVGTATAIVWMFSNFVTASEFAEYVTDQYYDSYYETLDRLYDAREEGNEDFARELERRLERLRAKICAEDPYWEQCSETVE
jgi:hypothetical protein